MESLALQSVLRRFGTHDGVLALSDGSITEVAARTPTPFFLYDRAVATAKYRQLQAALPDQAHVHYAVKANPHPDIVAHFLGLGSGFDVASRRELEGVLAAGADPEAVGFAGPGKSTEEIGFAIERGIGSLNVESARELEVANRLAEARGRTVNVMLRLNPPFRLKRAGMQMNGGPSAFGIDVEQVPALLRALEGMPAVNFRGFHVFAGSQNLDAELIAEFTVAVFEVLRELASAWGGPVEIINLGGGLGIPYHAADRELDLDRFAGTLAGQLERHREWVSSTRILLESGRYLVGECGIYVARVRYLKESYGKRFAVVEGGLNHHLAATGNLGMVVRKNYPIAVLNKMDEPARRDYQIVGPLCTPLDILGSDVALPELEEGDLIGVFCSGAYGRTASPAGFLSHPEAAEVVVGAAAVE
jgi:diaminopimelate decarboxylase